MDVNGLTLAVIARAGFGKTLRHNGREEEQEGHIPPGYRISFLRAIHDTTSNMVPILMLPGWLLNLISPLRHAHVAHLQLGKYLREMIGAERGRLRQDENHQSSSARGNLLTAVIRSSIELGKTDPNKEGTAAGTRKQVFNDQEVLGNLFIYLLAGFETTANAISYGLACLALHPEVQERTIQEVDAVCAAASSSEEEPLSYGEHFDKLQYLYGFMYEVFRLYPGVTLITKVALKPQTITTTTTSTHTLPAGTRVYLSSPGVHYHPRYWGPDPYKLDPTRWIDNSWTYNTSPPAGGASPSSTESIISNADNTGGSNFTAADKTRQMRGTLLTFSDGARSCLGRKFAQAEYVAFFAALLRDYRVHLAEGVDRETVKRDLDCKSAGKITLAPPYPVALRLEKRERS
ncbi:cytochrome P450 [Diplogelasinospora grovesii]|uniref:Cytochrome P450 n=1 Tax=Diplogelasinospora grovesii TaxID=303347 RepID=A0AAN6NLJ7_9PEZI|nr:cytochrome P450 [Diplogelasinospora grovesii]